MLDNSEIKQAIKFIVNNGRIGYYENLLNRRNIYYKEEIKEIRELFKIWLISYSWNDKDRKFMEDFINESMYEM